MEAVLECITQMAWQVDEQGNVVYSNQSTREYMGLSTDELSLIWEELVHPEDSDQAITAWNRILNERGSCVIECRVRKYNGKHLWHKINCNYVEALGSFICIANCTHEEKEGEEDTQRDHIYSQVIDIAPHPIVTFDVQDGAIITINRVAERLFQYPTRLLVGRSFNLLVPGSFQGGNIAGVLAEYHTNTAGHLLVVGGREPIMVTRRDGNLIPITLSLGHFAKDGRRVYIAVMHLLAQNGSDKDIKASKDSFLSTVSHELRTPLFGLLGTISIMQAAQDIELNYAKCEPIDPDAASHQHNPPVQQHSSEWSHPPSPHMSARHTGTTPSHSRAPSPHHSSTSPQIAASPQISASTKVAPLNLEATTENAEPSASTDYDARLKDLGLRLNNPTMLAHEGPIVSTTLHAELRQMEACGRNFLSIVNNMIDYYKLEHSACAQIAIPFHLHALVSEVCANYACCVAEGVEFVHTIKENVPYTLVADATLLRQVLSNLVSNGLRFTSKGKVEVVLEVQSTSSSSQALHFSVADTGVGIAPEFAPNVFRAFSQTDTTNRQYGGVGLGLVVCKRMLDLMGGTITFSSAVGRGSIFTVTTPVYSLTDPIPAPSPTPSLATPPMRHLVGQESDVDEDEERDADGDRDEYGERDEDEIRARNLLRSASLEFDDVRFPPLDLAKTRTGLFSIPEDTLLPSSPHNDSSPVTSVPTFLRHSSAPSSPRKVTLSPPLPPQRFLRRPSFPFALDDPTVTMMMLPSSAPSSTTSSPTPEHSSLAAILSQSNSPSSASTASPPISHTQSFLSASTSSISNSQSTSHYNLSLHIRVLVVEDNLVNQNVIKKMLKRMECLVVIANNGKEACDVLFEPEDPKYIGYHNFDMILMDCQMPVMDGFQATQYIRDWEAANHTPPIKIAALTANGSSENEKQCYEAGMDGFISKPVTLQGLRHILLPNQGPLVTSASR